MTLAFSVDIFLRCFLGVKTIALTGLLTAAIAARTLQQRSIPQPTDQHSARIGRSKTVFRDATNGVSFRYPASWKLTDRVHSYLLPKIIPNAAEVPANLQPTAVVELKAEDSIYANTNFASLDFVYVKSIQSDKGACDALAFQESPGANVQAAISPHPGSLQHLHTGDAGLCHQAIEDIYWAYRAQKCYLFEADLHTLCSGSNKGRDITEAELGRLKRDLSAVVQSTRIE